MPLLISLPLFGVLLMVQSAIVSQVHLLYGNADLLLLAVVAWALQERVKTALHWAVLAGLLFGLASALPFGAMLFAYVATTAIALLLKKQVWKVPVLAMFVITFLGTLITHAVSIIAIGVSGVILPLIDSLRLITLPSLLLNLLLAVPMYVFITDLANWLYPAEIEV
ncbi:MAG: hypothetical protein EHM70_12345 [Chloroflexota bacterium]|nr:MAG: hypothetical protein EHM70_12345 [Chloroflexota bacterium]